MSFFRKQVERWGGPRFAACMYLVLASLSLIRDGWQSLAWIAWLLMATGFLAIGNPETRQGRRHPPRYWLGVAVAFAGLGLLLYDSFVRK